MELKSKEVVNEISRILFDKNKDEKILWKKLKNVIFYLIFDSKLFLVGIFLIPLSGLIILPAPILIKQVVDIYLPEKNIRMIIILSIISILVYLFSLIAKIFTNYVLTIASNQAIINLRKKMFERIITLPISFFNTQKSGYLTTRVDEINRLSSIFSSFFVSLLISIFTFSFSIIIVGIISVKLLLITLIFIPINFSVIKFFTGGFRKVTKDVIETTAKVNQNVQEVLSGISTVKTFSRENKEKERIFSTFDILLKKSISQNIILSLSGETIYFLTQVSGVLVLLISAFLILNNELTIGLYIASAQYISQILQPVQTLASSGMVFQSVFVTLARMDEYFTLVGENDRAGRNIKVANFTGNIEFKNVSFSYEEGKKVFDNISFKVEKGEKVAIVGKNGSGKTTLLKLLLQLELPQIGNIFIDGIDISKIELSTLRKNIGIVAQDVFLFSDTRLSNNLAKEKKNDIIFVNKGWR
ncbi:MAG: ABC transporter ATP-binding protein [Brevinematia bacterium]